MVSNVSQSQAESKFEPTEGRQLLKLIQEKDDWEQSMK